MTVTTAIEPHNAKPAAVWSSAGARYDQVSRGIADSIEHCVLRLDPQPGERVLDLATGTGWTSRLVAKRGATVVGADIADDLIAGARERARAEGLNIEYRIGDAEKLPFADGEFDAVVSPCGGMFASRRRPSRLRRRRSNGARRNGFANYPATPSICVSKEARRSTASRAAKRHGTRSRPAMGRQDRSRRTTTRPAAPNYGVTSLHSTTVSRPSSASACR